MMRFVQTSFLLFVCSSALAAAPPVDDGTLGNLRFNMVALAQKSFQFDLDFQFTKRWTLGPSLAFFNTKASTQAGSRFAEDHTISGYGIAVRGNYYPKGVWKSGWYAETSLNYLTVTVTNKDSFNITASSTPNGVVLTGGGGYHWFWDTVNINLGLLLGYPLKPVTATIATTNTSSEDVQITGSGFSLGLRSYLGFTF